MAGVPQLPPPPPVAAFDFNTEANAILGANFQADAFQFTADPGAEVGRTVINSFQYYMTVRYRKLLEMIGKNPATGFNYPPNHQTVRIQANLMVHLPNFVNDTIMASSGAFAFPREHETGINFTFPGGWYSRQAEFRDRFQDAYVITSYQAQELINQTRLPGPYQRLFQYFVCYISCFHCWYSITCDELETGRVSQRDQIDWARPCWQLYTLIIEDINILVRQVIDYQTISGHSYSRVWRRIFDHRYFARHTLGVADCQLSWVQYQNDPTLPDITQCSYVAYANSLPDTFPPCGDVPQIHPNFLSTTIPAQQDGGGVRTHTRFAPRRPKTWINQNAGGGNTGTGPGGATGGGAGGITTTALRGHSTISRAMGSGTSICDRCGNFHGVGECPVCTNTVADSDQFDSAVLSAVFGLLNTNVGDSRRITNDDSIIRSPRDGWQQVMKNIVLQWALADAIQKQVADLEEAGGNVGSSEELSNYADYRLDPPLENSSSGFYSRSSTSTSPLKRSSTSSAASPAKRGKRESLLSSPRIMSTSADTNSNDTFNANRESMRRQIAAFALKQAGADGLKRLAQSWKDGGVTTEWNPILSSSALTDSTPAVESTPAITAFVAQLNAAGSEPLTPEQFRRMAQRQKDQSSTTQPIYGPNAAWVK